jgi:hypothetical protein
MIDLTRHHDGHITLHLDDDTARVLCSLITSARPRGGASLGGLTVSIEGPAAEPKPSHHPIAEIVGEK